jgi:hypothetical protein
LIRRRLDETQARITEYNALPEGFQQGEFIVTLDSTFLIAFILVAWSVFLIVASYFSKRRPSVVKDLSQLTHSPGQLVGVVEIIIWSIFPLLLQGARALLADEEPSLLISISYQLFIQWLGGSIIIGLVMLIALQKRRATVSGRSSPRILLILTLVLLFLLLAAVEIVY